MITLIGSSTTVIAFGLCGVDRIIEVPESAGPADIQHHVDGVSTPIIMLAERFVPNIKTDRLIIPIPDRYAESPVDRLDDLVRDVTGIGGS